MVLEKKEEVTALEMRLQALDKDLDWKKEVTAFFAIKVYTNTVEPLFDEPVYSVTSVLGYRFSRDTSIQGAQNLVPEKCWDNLCICYLYWRDTSIQGKRHFFGVTKPGFNLHSGDTVALKKWLTTKDRYNIDKLIMIFIHYLAAWNNDCSRF